MDLKPIPGKFIGQTDLSSLGPLVLLLLVACKAFGLTAMCCLPPDCSLLCTSVCVTSMVSTLLVGTQLILAGLLPVTLWEIVSAVAVASPACRIETPFFKASPLPSKQTFSWRELVSRSICSTDPRELTARPPPGW
jgi:hypothetical protein